MIKKILTHIKLQIAAGMANPSPPIGPALGQQGINIIEFCKLFNKKTESLEKGLIIPVLITVYYDHSFTFILKSPPTTILLKKIIGINNGSDKPKKNIVGKINKNQIKEIAKIKSVDMTGANLQSIIKTIEGTAYSMGINIVD